MTISYMTSSYKFESIIRGGNEAGNTNGLNENEIEEIVIGGACVWHDKNAADMPTKRFENMVVPLGIHHTKCKMEDALCSTDSDAGVINDKLFSKLFYSVAKDLGSHKTKSRTSVTKKNRR